MSTIQYNTIQWRWGLLLHHLFWYFKSRLFCSVLLQSQPDCVAGTKLLFPLFILAKQKSEGLANARCGCLVIGCFMCVQGFPFGIIPHTIYNICSMLVCILLYYYMHLNMDDILHWSTRMSLKPNKMYQQQQQQKTVSIVRCGLPMWSTQQPNNQISSGISSFTFLYNSIRKWVAIFMERKY